MSIDERALQAVEEFKEGDYHNDSQRYAALTGMSAVDMKTLTLSEVIAKLEEMKAQHGDVPLVLYDRDTSYYFTLTGRNFEFQQMEDGSIRASVGVNEYTDQGEDEPTKRPI